jgi:hypothetical protein
MMRRGQGHRFIASLSTSDKSTVRTIPEYRDTLSRIWVSLLSTPKPFRLDRLMHQQARQAGDAQALGIAGST